MLEEEEVEREEEGVSSSPGEMVGGGAGEESCLYGAMGKKIF